MLYQSSKRTCTPSSVLLQHNCAYTNNKVRMQVVLYTIQDKVNTCRSSHTDRTKKGHVGPNYALYFDPAGPLPVAQFGLARPKLDADQNICDRLLPHAIFNTASVKFKCFLAYFVELTFWKISRKGSNSHKYQCT